MTNQQVQAALRRSGRAAGSGPDPEVRRAVAAAAARAADEGVAEVTYAWMDSPLGRLLVADTDRGLVRVVFPDDGGGQDDALDELARELSPRVVETDRRLQPAIRQLREYFDGRRRDFDLPLDWRLPTDFRRRVLQELATSVPPGDTVSYGELAAAVGRPGGARAVGGAVGANPLPVVVPCHRVIRSDGSLGGYGGGLDRKRLLLRLEGVLPA